MLKDVCSSLTDARYGQLVKNFVLNVKIKLLKYTVGNVKRFLKNIFCVS